MDPVRGVTVIGDFLRPDGTGRPGGTDAAIAWLFNAIKRQIALASGMPVSLLVPRNTPELDAWVASLRQPEAADQHWASLYADLPQSEPLQRLVLDRLADQFCVICEAPPYLLRLLDARAIPYLDVRLHPVRFLDDLIFALRASHPTTQAALLAAALPESLVLATAGLREAMCQFISEATLPPETLVVVGQRPGDATQIHDGGFFNALTRRDEIEAICARYRAVVLKPHPSGDPHSLLLVTAGLPNVLAVVTDNLYRMLAMPRIAAVLTVNSSVAYEAGYFGKHVHALAPLPMRIGWRGAAPDASLHASLDDMIFCPDFWRTVLAPHAAVTPDDGMRLPAKPNRLRIALDSFWNFQEIDTDRIPGPPPPPRPA